MAQTLETPRDLLIVIAKILQSLRIDFFVSGGYAVCIWGQPRFTADIDIVINLEEKNIPDLAIHLKKELSDAYVDEEQMEDALSRVGEFNIIEPRLGLKVDFFILNNVEFDKSMLSRSCIKDIGFPVRFISPEDLIVAKLKWHKLDESPRHFEDIRSIVKLNKIDKEYLNKWVKKFNLEKEYKRVNDGN